MNAEEQRLRQRFAELAERAYTRGIYTFTDFLSLSEQSVLQLMRRNLSPAGCALYGGADEAERRMARFGSSELCGYEQAFPIACVAISPLNEKFADTLTHRDFLGALMHLGVKRETYGDIVLQGASAFLLCEETVAPFVVQELTRVRHTVVCCSIVDGLPAHAAPALSPEIVLVSSPRLDALIARAYHLSREESATLLADDRVFLDGAACNSAGTVPPDGCIVSVRGYGRFRLGETQGASKKGKLRILIEKYES